MTRTEVASGEAGFTLTELLMAITILGIIMIPLGASMFVGLRSSDRTAAVLATSADRQAVSVYFPPDVQSASKVDTTDASPRCTGDSGVRAVRLEWQEFDAVAPVTTYVADYRVVTIATEATLIRFACLASGPASVTAVAHHLRPSPSPVVAVSGPEVSLTLTDTLGTTYAVSGVRRSP